MAHFGPLNRHISIANHTVVLLDAPGLVEEDTERLYHGQSFSHWKPLRSGPVDFVNAIVEGNVRFIFTLFLAYLSLHSSNYGPRRATKPYPPRKRQSQLWALAGKGDDTSRCRSWVPKHAWKGSHDFSSEKP